MRLLLRRARMPLEYSWEVMGCQWLPMLLIVMAGLPVTVQAVGDDTLEWTCDEQTTQLSVRRGGADLPWKSGRLAEVTYWDDSGTQKRQEVADDTGWTIEFKSDGDTRQALCRQNELGLSFQMEFSVRGDVLTVEVPAAEIAETGAARLRTLRLLPRFGAATEGEEGYLVIAQQSGATCLFRDKKPASTGCRFTRASASVPCRCLG